MPKGAKSFLPLILFMGAVLAAYAQEAPKYDIFFGTTHGHSFDSGDARKAMAEGNTPAIHFAEAKKNGFQFYVITDHSQYDTFTPESWAETQREAEQNTDKDFVAMRGFEYSENNGPGGKGHLNAFNTPEYLNALQPGNDLNKFYGWLVKEGKAGTVMACFNHPGPKQYQDWDYFSADRREAITMLEVINGTKKSPDNPNVVIGALHYQALLHALDKGWRVSPVAGLDAHTPQAIHKASYRTAVVAEKLTRQSLLDGMKQRRTYATRDKNLHVLYTVNGQMMGSVLPNPARLKFDIRAWDPDEKAPKDRITKIEIVGDDDALVASREFDAHKVAWAPELEAKYKYYLLKVYTAEMPEPTAYLAPVWTGK